MWTSTVLRYKGGSLCICWSPGERGLVQSSWLQNPYRAFSLSTRVLIIVLEREEYFRPAAWYILSVGTCCTFIWIGQVRISMADYIWSDAPGGYCVDQLMITWLPRGHVSDIFDEWYWTGPDIGISHDQLKRMELGILSDIGWNFLPLSDIWILQWPYSFPIQ